jgi:hypothetical protein
MNKIKILKIESHFATSKNVVCIGKTINDDMFLLVIFISKKQFPQEEYDSQDETFCITKYEDMHYKIEVSLFPKRVYYPITEYQRKKQVFYTLTTCYENIYKLYKKNRYIIKTSDNYNFDYKLYDIPRNVWLISTGYVIGVV